MTTLLRLAIRNVLRNRRRSVITFSAVFLAVAVMVILDGLSVGMVAGIRDAMVLGQSGALQVHRKGHLAALEGASLDRTVSADDAFLARVSAVPGVTGVSPRLVLGAMASTGDQTIVALFRAFDPRLEARVCPRRGELPTLTRPGAVVFTPELAEAIALEAGETVTLLGSDVDGALNAVEAELAGTYGLPGLPTAERRFGFLPLELAQELVRLPQGATEVAIALEDLDQLEVVRERLQRALGPEYELVSWRELAPWVDGAMATNAFMLGLLSAIFLFVALLGIVNTMLMSVLERTREIGTMMSLGARRGDILRLFLLEAGCLGFLGGALGAITGSAVVFGLGVRGISLQLAGMAAPLHLHPATSPGFVLVMVAVATLGAVVAALWPSFRASRLRPVQALASV